MGDGQLTETPNEAWNFQLNIFLVLFLENNIVEPQQSELVLSRRSLAMLFTRSATTLRLQMKRKMPSK